MFREPKRELVAFACTERVCVCAWFLTVTKETTLGVVELLEHRRAITRIKINRMTWKMEDLTERILDVLKDVKQYFLVHSKSK